MRIFTVTDSEFGENCYIIAKEKYLYVIDPGIDYDAIAQVINNAKLPVKSVFLTHGHYDHVFSIKNFGNIPVYAHEAEKKLLEDPALNLSEHIGTPFSIKGINYYGGDRNTIDGFEILSTPGHTAGCVVISIDGCLFSGDTLFYDTVGRTDLPTGDSKALQKSMKLFDSFDKNIKVYPGHGGSFILGDAYKTNYFLQRKDFENN